MGSIFIFVEYGDPETAKIAQVPEYIGPFPDPVLAGNHRQLYGPISGKVIRTNLHPDKVMTPGEHVDFVINRGF